MGHTIKTIRTIIVITTLVLCLAQTGLAQRSLTKQQARRYLRNLPAVDKIELMALRSDDDRQDTQLVASKVISGAEARKLAALWRAQSYGPDRAACHEPSYAVKFYVKGRELVHASVCWGCNNILFFAPDFIGGLHFEGESKKGEQLYKFFQEAFTQAIQTKSSQSLSFISDKKQ